MTTYHITRMSKHHRARRVPGMSGLTLEQAQAHCEDTMTHGLYRRGNLWRGMGRCQEHGVVSGERCPKCNAWLERDWFDGYDED